MRSNGVKRLEIAEIILLMISIISIIIGGVTGKLIYPIIFILLTQVLSLLNRFRFQQTTRRRVKGLHKQMIGQNRSTEITQASPTTSVKISQSPEITQASPLPTSVKTPQPPEKPTPLILNTKEKPTPLVISTIPSTQSLLIPKYQTKYQLNGHQEAVSSLTISPDNRYLISVSWDQTLKLWELSTGKLLKGIIAHSSGILAIVFLGQQDQVDLATGSFDQTLKLWKIEQNPKGIEINLKTTLRDHSGSLQCLAFNSNSQILISGSYDQTIKQWKMPEGSLLATGYDQSGSIYAIACAPSGQYIASAGGDGQVILWQLKTETRLGTLVGNISSVQSLAISPDSKIVAAGCLNGQIVLWQVENNQLNDLKPFRIFQAHHGPIKALVFSSTLNQPNFLFSGGADGTIYLWHLDSTEPLNELIHYSSSAKENKPISSLVLSSDEKYLVAGDVSGKIKLWLRE